MKKASYIDLSLPDSDIRYYEHFLTASKSDQLFKMLRNTIPFKQDQVRVFGKWYDQPRLTALTAVNTKPYSYSGLTLQPTAMPDALLSIKHRLDELTGQIFSSCLINLYRNGKDSNGWHADDEAELGLNPVIASVSLGEERVFHLKHKNNKALRHKMVLKNGSLLLMAGSTQHFWLHQLPKTAKEIGERINLTFRVIQ